jgi:type VI secretion system protein ImpE
VRSLLEAEEERRRVHEEGHRPGVPPGDEEVSEDRLGLLAAMREGQPALEQALQRVGESSAPVAGRLNETSYDSIANHDDFLGPVIEIFAGGRCLWMSLDHVRRIEMKPPAALTDLLWLPAQLEDQAGTRSMVHLPVCYAGSHKSQNDLVRLGRVTEWEDVEGMAFRGIGQNTFMCQGGGSEAEEVSLLDVREMAIGAG